MASRVDDAVLSVSSEQHCVEPLRRDVNTTSQMWQGGSYCTPESAPLNRCAATRRLCYAMVQPAPFLPFHTPAAISTEPTSTPNNSVSDDPHAVALTLSKVVEGQQDVMSSFHFNDEQIDCICDVLRQSNDVERLRCFLSRLTPDQLQRDSEPLYKVTVYTHNRIFTNII